MTSFENPVDIIGFIGGLTLSTCLIPQIYKTYKTKNADSISLTWQSLYIIGLTCSNIYVYHYKLLPLLIPSTIEMFFIISLFLMKLKFSYWDSKQTIIFNNSSTQTICLQSESSL